MAYGINDKWDNNHAKHVTMQQNISNLSISKFL